MEATFKHCDSGGASTHALDAFGCEPCRGASETNLRGASRRGTEQVRWREIHDRGSKQLERIIPRGWMRRKDREAAGEAAGTSSCMSRPLDHGQEVH